MIKIFEILMPFITLVAGVVLGYAMGRSDERLNENEKQDTFRIEENNGVNSLYCRYLNRNGVSQEIYFPLINGLSKGDKWQIL